MKITPSLAPMLAGCLALGLAVEIACTGTMDLGHDLRPDGGLDAAGGAGGGGGGAGGSGGAGGMGVCMPGSIAPCYTGPIGTENKGICAAGMKTCNAGGTGYGICQGEVTPQVENCATPEDEDCDGLSPACTGTLLWADRFGGTGEQRGLSIAVDKTGDLFVTGYVVNAIDFGGGALSSQGGADVFLAKLDGAGNHLWSKSFGGAEDQFGISVATDASGNALLTGRFSGAISFGGAMLTSKGGMDAFVAKFDTSGNHMWSKALGGQGDQYGVAVRTDGGGNIFLSGYYTGTIDLEGSMFASGGGLVKFNSFLAKFDATGEHIWSKSFGTSTEVLDYGLMVDSAGDVVMTGQFTNTVDFGNGELVGKGKADVFLAKFNASGNPMWSKSFGDSESQIGLHAAADEANNVLVLGQFAGTIDFGGSDLTTLASAGGNDVFVAKLDASGEHLWSKRFGYSGDQLGASIVADGGGSVLIAGQFAGTIDFGGNALVSPAGETDGFLAKLDAFGGHVWSRKLGGGGGFQRVTDVDVDAGGNAFITGYFDTVIDLGDGLLLSAGGSDVFVAKLSP